MRVYKVKAFARFQRREGIADEALIEAVRRAERGLVDAGLGGGLIKQRIARPGQGRRAGYRAVIAHRSGDMAVFLIGFAKNDRANLDQDELDEVKGLARVFLALSAAQIGSAIAAGELMEVRHDDQDQA